MKIAINLGSILLGKALKQQLDNELEISDVRMLDTICDADVFSADFYITDAHTIKHQRRPCLNQSKIILLDYGFSEETIAALLLSSKIDGIMTTDTDLNTLIKAFHAIKAGQIWIDNSKIKALVNFAENSNNFIVHGKLSRKEREVVIIVSQGHTNKEIASKLHICEQTVKTHINSIFKKLNVSRRTQLVPFGIKLSVDSIY